MKKFLTILALMVCACSVATSEKAIDEKVTDEKGTNELAIDIRITRGERSRDSSSHTTTIKVEQDKITWTNGIYGGRRTTTAPVRKEFELSLADKRNLVELIKSNDLLVTDSISVPQNAPGFYFDVSLGLTLDDRTGAINISAPRTDETIKNERLYKNTLAFVIELHRIMNRQDKSIPVCATFFC